MITDAVTPDSDSRADRSGRPVDPKPMLVAAPQLGDEEIEAVASVMRTGWLGMGPTAERFEAELRSYLGTEVVVVSSGSAALHLAVTALGVARGDEVILPSFTYVSCAQAVVACGAKPIFAEVDPDTLCLSSSDVSRRVTEKTRAIMPVHYGGQPCDMSGILAIAEEHSLNVIEDAAQAFGSTYEGQRVGTLGDAGCFSFDPIKPITCGEGGAVAVRDPAVAQRLRQLRFLGIRSSVARPRRTLSASWEVVSPGYRNDMSDMHAAIGLVQLRRLAEIVELRRQLWRRYRDGLVSVEGVAVLRHDVDSITPFSFVIRVLHGRRDDLKDALSSQGIQSGVHYRPLHCEPFFAEPRVSLPVSEQLYSEVLTLPLHAGLTVTEIERVVACIRSLFRQE